MQNQSSVTSVVKHNMQPIYLLHEIYKFDSFYLNQFDIRNDSVVSNCIQTLENILLKKQNTVLSYENVLNETQIVYQAFTSTYDGTINNHLLENRQRALVYNDALRRYRNKNVSNHTKIKHNLTPIKSSFILKLNHKSLQVNRTLSDP